MKKSVRKIKRRPVHPGYEHGHQEPNTELDRRHQKHEDERPLDDVDVLSTASTFDELVVVVKPN